MKTPLNMGPGFKVVVRMSATWLISAFVLSRAYGQETLYSFPGAPGQFITLMQATNGDFYGTTSAGGTGGYGTVFNMTSDGTLTTLVSFANTNGSFPSKGGLIQASDGNFYGTTYNGGNLALGSGAGLGTVFKMTPAGALTRLFVFTGPNGGHPTGGVVQASDGNFYGTTYWGGDLSKGGGSGLGTVFKITSNGTFALLYAFSGTDGGHPNAGLAQGSDGNLYGTTSQGGDLAAPLGGGNGLGTLFSITPDGTTLTPLVPFNGDNGGNPDGGLVKGSDGNFYGTTYWGGDLTLNSGQGYGSAFQLTPGGGFTMLATFNGTNGAHPYAGLVQGSDGNFYGTTYWGGDLTVNGGNGYGSVFRMSSDGTIATLVKFTGGNGAYPYFGVIRASDGNLYGATSQGGSGGGGTIFRLAIGPGLSISQQPGNLSVSVGANALFQVTALGKDPLGYQWQFNGTAVLNATNPSLTVANAQATNGGSYTVVVTDNSGSVTSRVAALQVDAAFTKITAGAIVTHVGTATGCAWADYDNDGFIDLIITSADNPSNNTAQNNLLFHNNRDGTFTEVTNTDVTLEARDWRGCSWVDYDNDGFLDLYLASTTNNGFPAENELFRNNRDGTFTKMTAGAVGPIVPGGGSSESPVWADFDRDGFADVYIARSGTGWFYRNNGDGTFTQVTTGAVAKYQNNQGSYNAAWGDYDNDGWPDLFVSAYDPNLQNGTNFLYHNGGSAGFSRVLSGPVATDNEYSIGCAWGDYDNDGNLDLFVANGLTQPATCSLYHNNGDGTFNKMSSNLVGSLVSDLALSAQCAWGDYDNDGYLDLYVTVLLTTGVNHLYHNNGDGTFTRVTTGSLVNDIGASIGCAWGDYDNDGFLDLFVARGGDILPTANVLYRNNGNSNAWLRVKLVGTVSSRSAIGAKVRAKASIGGKTFWQLREINTGDGFCAGPLEAHFGLGNATNIETLRIEWPSGAVQEFPNVAPRQILTITEPPRLMATLTNGVPQFSIKGGRGFQYDIEASTNLAAWSPISTLTITNLSGLAQIIDNTAPGANPRFYRAVSH
ncbi:MAG TPA: choice-of-anchor tandem repeat GloVer-containing protein [Candidatus Saccharimonadales bacterium]|nr:choice-of-anchor tandem repeat GloVer-containing protein [Candidatus Saccharimonadales bacterium]